MKDGLRKVKEVIYVKVKHSKFSLDKIGENYGKYVEKLSVVRESN